MLLNCYDYDALLLQQTASMATVEVCEGSDLGAGFQLLVGLTEIHVPRMWVEEDKGHSVSVCGFVGWWVGA